MQINRNSEKGQAIVILVLGVVVFLGFVALAIDGGMVLSDRRHAQNSGDAASLAGGGDIALYLENAQVHYSDWDCATDPNIAAAMLVGRNTAINRAASNGFPNLLDGDLSTHYGVSTTCGEENYGYIDRFIDVTVEIFTTTETSFAQLLFPTGELESQVVAVTRVRPSMPLAYGHAIVALNNGPCVGNQNGATFGGSSTVSVNGGGIWTNGCLRGNGGSYFANVTNGSVNYAGSTSGTMNFNPTEQSSTNPIPPSSYQVSVPTCAGAHNHTNLTLNNGTLDLAPGLHCVSGNMRINGGTLTGYGVTIYLPIGNVTVNGNADVHLFAPEADPDPDPAIPGVLFYVAEGDIDMEGNNTSEYQGLVYAPRGEIKAHGSSGTTPTFSTQLVGWDVDVSGNASVDINFNAGELYAKPSSIELFE